MVLWSGRHVWRQCCLLAEFEICGFNIKGSVSQWCVIVDLVVVAVVV